MGDSAVFGLSFMLLDNFSGISDTISSKMDELGKNGQGLSDKLSKSFAGLTTGLGFLAAGGGILAGFGSSIKASADFEGQMNELSAITGVVGKDLDDIGNRVLELGTKFGGEPIAMVDSFKTILSRLGPDIAKSPIALQNMGDAVQTLSKTMGGDTIGSVNALTTAMLQYGIDLSDPINASESMTNQMNVMAAAAQVGSAEVPQIAETLKVAGLAANKSGLSFEEFNAAVQVMGKGTVYGAEAGTALRNVLGKLGESRFIPKDTAKELVKAGVNIETLADTTIPLSERLKELNKIQNDTALVGKFFGVENKNAAMLLMDNVDSLKDWTVAVGGTSSATEQAQKIMAGYNESMKRMDSSFTVLAISIGDALRPAMTSLVNLVTSLTVSFSNFLKTPIGVFLIKTVASLGLLLTGVGALMVVVNGSRLAFALFSPTIWASVTAMGALLVSMLPFIAIGAILYGTFEFLSQSVETFNKFVEDGITSDNTLITKMMQFGGILKGVWAIFESLNNEGFTLPEDVNNALQKLGILDLVVSIGTYIVRGKALIEGFAGAFSGFVEQVGSVFMPFVTFVKNIFNEFLSTIIDTGRGFEKSQSPLEKFSEIGRNLANYVIIPLQWALKGVSIILTVLQGVMSVGLGIFQGFIGKLSWVKQGFDFLITAIEPITTWFQGLNTTTEQSGSKMQMLVNIGNILGQVFSGILTGAFYMLGFAVKGLIVWFSTLGDIFMWVFDKAKMLFDYIANSAAFKTISALVGGGLDAIGQGIGNMASSSILGVGSDKLATQVTDMKQNSSSAMANFENNTVRNKQAETVARTPVVNNTNNNSVNMSSTPVVLQIDKQTLGTTMIDFMSSAANN